MFGLLKALTAGWASFRENRRARTRDAQLARLQGLFRRLDLAIDQYAVAVEYIDSLGWLNDNDIRRVGGRMRFIRWATQVFASLSALGVAVQLIVIIWSSEPALNLSFAIDWGLVRPSVQSAWVLLLGCGSAAFAVGMAEGAWSRRGHALTACADSLGAQRRLESEIYKLGLKARLTREEISTSIAQVKAVPDEAIEGAQADASDFNMSDVLRSRLGDELVSRRRNAYANGALGLVAIVASGLWIQGEITKIESASARAERKATSAQPDVVAQVVSQFPASYTHFLALGLSSNILGFFLLWNYRRYMADVRYYHNELSTIELKLISVELVSKAGERLSSGSGDLFNFCVRQLASSERHIVLARGESTAYTKNYDSDARQESGFFGLFSGARPRI